MSPHKSLPSNENPFENLVNPIPLPLSRSPLTTIQDPLQTQEQNQESESDSRGKVGTIRSKKVENLSYGTPKTGGAKGVNAVQSVNSARRVVGGGCNFSRVARGDVRGGGNERRGFRGISSAGFAEGVRNVPCFELVEDPSFWTDHNVQVLIRIRPISTSERAMHGNASCLMQDSSQSLTWLGHPETRFTFDHIASETISQEKLFKVAGLPMVENCMSGYNSCMFAYGQTGSGKTYTMMGEINELDGTLNEDCGMTPRIFEYLFTRIRAEEEFRSTEKLKYSCKCSFLEIYNEHITDLLEPSSTNLQIREDMRKGVYVENLAEYEVTTVKDVLQLLLKGATNRKMAATNMNSESSRSHSVFTCIIESRWDIDSMTHFRFGRLNLVDLAGSERQKSSGAEGERLKEAANINKSLSTLGLVINTLVVVAHGKHRHVPYRDSRLTFLLQDSLGGNSKTTIIANISPSTCSANETLSTLKFAQRAKLIQNNAKVNENASGDVMALQRQIQQLKDQVTFLHKHQKLSNSLSSSLPDFDKSHFGDLNEIYDSSLEGLVPDHHNNIPQKKIKCIKATLVGALRREKMAENTVGRLEAEIEHMNRLVHQQEEDAQRAKMILRFREEKIKRLELLSEGLVSSEEYLTEENNALSEEIQLLQEKVDRNPELTRFALENLRLLEQLRMYQDFYEQGEREIILAEVSELRDQLMEMYEGTPGQLISPSQIPNQDKGTEKELEDCRRNLDACLEINEKLTSELDHLRGELDTSMNFSGPAFDSAPHSLCMDAGVIKEVDTNLPVESESVRTDSEDEIASYNHFPLKNSQDLESALGLKLGDAQRELMDARSLIDALEQQQLYLIEELDILQKNSQYVELLKKDSEETQSQGILGNNCKSSERHWKTGDRGLQNGVLLIEGSGEIITSGLQAKLSRLNRELEEARILNQQYQDDQASNISHQSEVEKVRQQVEVETAETILHLQEELAILQEEFKENLIFLTNENTRLLDTIKSKDNEIRMLTEDSEKVLLDLTSFLVDGCRSLEDAFDYIRSSASSFTERKVWMGKHVEKTVKIFVEKEKAILQLQKSLEDAKDMGMELKLKLSTLQGATLAVTEVRQLENDKSTREVTELQMLLNEKMSKIEELEMKLKPVEDHIVETERDTACLTGMESLSNFRSYPEINVTGKETFESLSFDQDKYRTSESMAEVTAQAVETIHVQVEMAKQMLLEFETVIYASYADAERHLSSLITDVHDTPTFAKLAQDLIKDIRNMSKKVGILNDHNQMVHNHSKVPLLDACKSQKLDINSSIEEQIRNELRKTNLRLDAIKTGIDALLNEYGCSVMVENLEKIGTSTVGLSPCSDITVADTTSKDLYKPFPSKLESKFPGGKFIGSGSTSLCLREQIELALNSFLEVHGWFTKSFDLNGIETLFCTQGKCFHGSLAFGIRNRSEFDADREGGFTHLVVQETAEELQSLKLSVEEAGSGCSNTREMLHQNLSDGTFVADEEIKMNGSFLSKFEEAHATLEEADFMLNALLKANENAKQISDMWKQVSEELMIEREGLIEEVQHLKWSVSMKEGEYEAMQDEMHASLVEITELVSSLEGSFLQMKRDVEERFKVLCSDIASLGQDLLGCICNTRSSLEDIWSEIVEKGFAFFVLYQCYAGKIFRETSSLSLVPGFLRHREKMYSSIANNAGKGCTGAREGITIEDHSENLKSGLSDPKDILELQNSYEMVQNLEEQFGLSPDKVILENFSLKTELSRKEKLLEGLLFDISLLQESTSNSKDIKDETEEMFTALTRVQHELATKTTQLDDILLQHRELEAMLTDSEAALSIANYELDQAKETIDIFTKQNSELKVLLEDFCVRERTAEKQLDEEKEVVKSLEKEILQMAFSVEERVLSSVENVEDELRRVTRERGHLQEVVACLNDKLEMANALADENEAIAVEARQESEASKMYAEQKEEEAKILEHSVEELEQTINVLERKVNEMSEEVQKHQLMRDDLELELQSLRLRMLTVQNVTGNSNAEQKLLVDRLVECEELRKHTELVEKEKVDQAREIKECREYISELLLHAEAQASQYQHQYKMLEDMVREVKKDPSAFMPAPSAMDKSERASSRTRGSSSPFRCISSLVQQMNLEKDQELSVARLRIEELEALASRRQKEVCMLSARLAAADNMTHDVIRDLLGVKLDMTNYANLIDQHQVQKLIEGAQRETEEYIAKEQEILQLREQIKDLVEERQSCIEELNQREADVLAVHVTLEQLKQRDQMLKAQNEMLKMDKANLKRKIAEMDETLKHLRPRSFGQQIKQPRNMKENSFLRASNDEVGNTLKLFSSVNDELAWYYKSDSSDPHETEEQRLRNKRHTTGQELEDNY